MEVVEYRKMADVEDQMWYYRALHDHVVSAVRPADPATVGTLLDAGCGTGGLLRRLAAAYPRWQLTGLDFSALACELARERSGCRVECGSVASLPFADHAFDVIVSCDVLCQVADEDAAWRELVRCLKPGGVLVVTMPAYAWMFSYHDRAVANLRRYTRAQVAQRVREAGLAVVADTYWNTLPFPLAVVKRKLLPHRAGESDVGLFPPPVEAFFRSLMAVEHGWVENGGTLPFGSSVLTLARKPAKKDPSASR